MRLSKRQKEILIGLILGDGCLEKNGNNVRLRVEHGLKQEEYLKWLYEEFKNISQKPRIVSNRHPKNGKIYKRLHFSTLSLKCLNIYRSIFYVNKQKVIPDEIEKILASPLSLAIWFMDDGYKRNDCNALRISSDSFSRNDQLKLMKCLEDNFCVKSKLHKKGKNWNIYIPEKYSKVFCDLVCSYIIPSMKYKINLTP
jgi:hypothetical protein